MWLFRFVAPLFGAIFSLMAFLLAKLVTKNDSVALLAALFATMSDVIIFYQSEYHPQGLALLLFVVLVYVWLRLVEKGSWAYGTLFGIGAGSFLLSHHFSSLYIGLLVFSFVIGNQLLRLIYKRRGFSLATQPMANLRRGYAFLICFGGAVMLYHFILYPTASEQFMAEATTAAPGIALHDVPLFTFLLRLAKWGILSLGVASIVYILRKPTREELSLILLLVLIMLTGALGMACMLGELTAGVPIDRFIAFYAPLISIFAAMTVHKLLSHTKSSVKRPLLIKGATILGAGVLLAAGFFNAQIPAFYFKSSSINTFYWYSNRLPVMEQYKPAGEWIGEYTPDNSRYGVEFHTRVIPFFYGQKPGSSLNSTWTLSSVDYALINPTVPYWQGESRLYSKSDVRKDLSGIYANGELVLYYNTQQERREY